MEWLDNIWAWFQGNWDAIAAVLSTITTVCFIPLAKIINSQKTNIATNTNTTKELKATIEQTKELKNVVETNTINIVELGNKVNNATAELDALHTEYKELKTTFLQVNAKLGSILDVMSIVYATMKDETVRNSIANIINSVKYNDSAIESEVKAEENKAKENIAAQNTAALQAQIKELETKVNKNSVQPVEHTTNVVQHIETKTNTNNVRY